MNVKIYPTEKLCWIRVSETEALQLIRSLTNQLRSKNPNNGRLESFCDRKSDVSEITISVQF